MRKVNVPRVVPPPILRHSLKNKLTVNITKSATIRSFFYKWNNSDIKNLSLFLSFT